MREQRGKEVRAFRLFSEVRASAASLPVAGGSGRGFSRAMRDAACLLLVIFFMRRCHCLWRDFASATLPQKQLFGS